LLQFRLDAPVDAFERQHQPGRAYARRGLLAASCKGEALAQQLEKAEPLSVFLPFDPDAITETIVQGVLASGGYPFSLS
jgi:hypothetical protein